MTTFYEDLKAADKVVRYDDKPDYNATEDGHAICYKCKGMYLHFTDVSVFMAAKGEDELGLETKVKTDGHSYTVRESADRRPHSRRACVKVYMRCEHCGILERPLTMGEHKGLVIFFWDTV